MPVEHLKARHVHSRCMRSHGLMGSTQMHQVVGNRIRCQPVHALGKCWLVGSGPGSTDYLTLKAVELIKTADVIVYDDLAAEEALQLSKPSTEKVYVGKRGGESSTSQANINDILLKYATKGKQVVRLKGGCPSVFSRVNSEMAALAAANIQYELVPGVSSALAAPLFAGFPLTDVDLGKSFAVVSGHDVEGTDWAGFGSIDTLVVLMGGRNLATIVGKLVESGRNAETQVAVIRAAGTAEQQVWKADLNSIVAATAGKKLSPCIVVVGQVVGLPAQWQSQAAA